MSSFLRKHNSFKYQVNRANQLVQRQYPHLQLSEQGINTIKEMGQEDLPGAVEFALWKNQTVRK
jgi:hypothetical protein